MPVSAAHVAAVALVVASVASAAPAVPPVALDAAQARNLVAKLDLFLQSIGVTLAASTLAPEPVYPAPDERAGPELSSYDDAPEYNTTVMEPESASATSALILVHGLGSSPEQLQPIITAAKLAGLSETRFVLPQAPDQYVGYRDRTEASWFNIESLDNDANENEKEIVAAARGIERLVVKEIVNGIPASKVGIMGFSQGGGVALTTLMRSEVALGAAVGLATWLPLRSSYPAELSPDAADAPLYLAHGTEDKVVPISYVRTSARKIDSLGRTVTLKEYEGEGHTLQNSGLEVAMDVLAFLKKELRL